MPSRLSRVRERLSAFDADAVLLSSLPSIRWASGFSGSNALLLVTPDSATFVTDGRYTEQAHQEVDGADVRIASEGLMSCLVEEDCLAGLHRVIFQSDDVTVAVRQKLDDKCPAVQWVPEAGFLTHQIAEKEEQEIRAIQRAQSLTERVYEEVLDILRPGVTERKVAAEITYRHLLGGAEKMAFDPIVASGPNAARPHARPTDRVLEKGDLVVIDMGAVLDGYASDMTRTVAIGEPSAAARTGYDVVLRAQRRALEAARAGLKGKDLDAVARDIIEEAGLGDFFSHGLGHGIGLEVHEWPRVSYSVDDPLPHGACVTIEPGVYVPEEGYGVRIEDIVVLREEGCMNLTGTKKELTVIRG
jgi:Xaa-Pro aminopeptidase